MTLSRSAPAPRAPGLISKATSMTSLITSILVLAVAPLIYHTLRGRSGTKAGLDGFIFVSMGGLILADILPASFAEGGWPVIPVALAGLFVPFFLERNFRRIGRSAHFVTLVLGLGGLCIHSVFDGLACAEGGAAAHDGHAHELGHSHLPYAVVLHSLPVGLTVWWLIRRAFGRFWAQSVIGLISGSRVAGYAVGEHLFETLDAATIAAIQALVAGSLLHVVFHRPHEGDSCSHGEGEKVPAPAPPTRSAWAAGVGGLIGLALVAALLGENLLPSDGEHDHGGFVDNLLELSLDGAPALLLGYALAGFIGVFLPGSSVRWMSRGGTWSQAVRGVAIGLPIPVCSCGVVPLYRTLVTRGAAPAAAMAFLVATPELGLDAILLSLPLLGGEFTLVRVGAAAIVALVIGALVGRVAPGRPSPAPQRTTSSHADGTSDDKENGTVAIGSAASTRARRVLDALRLGFFEVFDHTGPWIILGLLIAAGAMPFIEGSFLATMPPWLQVLAFALLGVPAYVCASGATPLVAVLLLGGVSPGAALAFLLTGPATNVSTFGVLRDLHGRRVAAVFSVLMIGLAVALGIATNAFLESPVASSAEHVHDHASPWRVAALVALGVLVVLSILRRGPREFVATIFSRSAGGTSTGDDAGSGAARADADADADVDVGNERAGSCCGGDEKPPPDPPPSGGCCSSGD